jgi:putative addiction module component (TIGR02574 family)
VHIRRGRPGLGVGGIIGSVTEKTSNLLQQALALSEKERADLACSLMDSLDPTVDEDAAAAWNQEIARRIADLDSGQAKTVPWDEVRGRIFSKLSNGKKES